MRVAPNELVQCDIWATRYIRATVRDFVVKVTSTVILLFFLMQWQPLSRYTIRFTKST